MIKNQWYVAEYSDEIPNGGHKRVKMLGLEFVVFRDSKGKISCLSDVCIHRGASLGSGMVVDDAIECPYHGWRFNGGGKCVKIPSQEPGVKIPPRAKVDAYPVLEKYGMIWVFMGDLPEAERPPLPPFPEFEDPAWRCIRGTYEWKANYARITENGIDPSHAAFVHPSFGDKEAPQVHEFTLEQDEWSAYAELKFVPPEYKGMWKFFRKAKRSMVTVRNGFHVSGAHVRIQIRPTPTWSTVIFDVNTPIDETTTITRWIMARNFLTQKIWDGDSRRRTLRIFEQDRVIMEKVCPELLPVYLHEEVSVKSDGIMVAWRNKRRELIEKGWALDVDAMERDVQGKRAMVIPSPDRANPAEAKDFLLKTVPLVDGERVRAEALKQRHGGSAPAAAE